MTTTGEHMLAKAQRERGYPVSAVPRHAANGGTPAGELKPGDVMHRGWVVDRVCHYVGRDGLAMTSATGHMPVSGERFSLNVRSTKAVAVR